MATRRKQRQDERNDQREKTPLLQPKNENQAAYLKSIKENDQTFGVGPAGTGKTYIASAYAAQEMIADKKTRLILCRPAVEAGGEKLGFLPGDIDEKMAPWTYPFLDVIRDFMGKQTVQTCLDNGRIRVVPFAHMRGVTFRHSIVILDEAQNTTPLQIKLFLTRIGENAKIIVNGDPKQKDIPGRSGLDTALGLAGYFGIPAGIVHFGQEDIVRSGICQMWVEAFEHV